MHLDNSFISTTLCDDLARAAEAKDGKKICASHFVSCTVEVLSGPPYFYWFFGSCFGGHNEAGLSETTLMGTQNVAGPSLGGKT